MPNLFAFIATGWELYKKQPVLNRITLWILFPAMWLSSILNNPVLSPLSSNDTALFPLGLIGAVIIIVLVSVGQVSTLLVAKRLLGHPAGRNRTSIRQVLKQSQGLIIPLLLTGVLRACFTFLWGLLLIIPGIMYYIRTYFYDVFIVSEHQMYRRGLRASTTLAQEKTLTILLYIIGMYCILFVPVHILSYVLNTILAPQAPVTYIAVHAIDSILIAYATMFELLTKTAFMKELNVPLPTINTVSNTQ